MALPQSSMLLTIKCILIPHGFRTWINKASRKVKTAINRSFKRNIQIMRFPSVAIIVHVYFSSDWKYQVAPQRSAPALKRDGLKKKIEIRTLHIWKKFQLSMTQFKFWKLNFHYISHQQMADKHGLFLDHCIFWLEVYKMPQHIRIRLW